MSSYREEQEQEIERMLRAAFTPIFNVLNVAEIERQNLYDAMKPGFNVLIAQKQKEADAKIISMKADIAQAIGYCQGLGKPNSYLEKRYPEIAKEQQ